MTFIAQFGEIQAEIERQGIAAYDMRDEGHLELVFVGASGIDRDDGEYRERVKFRFLTGESGDPREIRVPLTAAPIRYFLDGTQRTLRAFYCQNIPIVAGIVAAAVLERSERGEPRIMPGMIAFRHAWIIPMRSGIPEIDRLIALIHSKGGEVVDPLDHPRFAGDRYAEELHEFGGLLEHAFKRVGGLRTEIELDLLRRWCANRQDDGLLLVDGPLREEACGAIGLVKAFTRQYFMGAEATTLFRLRHGHRTAAFTVEDFWRAGHTVDAWYQRHFDASGRDPRHALIRIELSSNAPGKPDIDDVAGWVMRERVPAAKADARWATLLYPVHYLEEILKRHIDAQTRGWTRR
ncbi:MAG: hypothetical protein IT336_08245 [Thermomicrobiales bacterium]|nr:hypothetical protein [Thermomicrobiales bacterium]